MTPKPLLQRGAVALAVLLLLSLVAAWRLATVPQQSPATARDATTQLALSHARQVLIDWAVQRRGVSGNGVSNLARPGALPCPDLHVPGSANAGYVGNDKAATCNTATGRLGRVPWRSLQQQERRDGAGETLWLALAEPFHDSSNVPLNPATPGVWLTAVDVAAGVALSDASDPVVAVLLAPGPALALQNRYGATAQIKPANYLEQVTQGGRKYSNVDLAQTPFAGGDVLDGRGRVLLNDRLAVIRRSDLMPALQARAVRHYLQLLGAWQRAYGQLPSASEGGCAGQPDSARVLVEQLSGRAPAWQLEDAAWLYRNLWHEQLFYAVAAGAGAAHCAAALTLTVGAQQWPAQAVLSTQKPAASAVAAGRYRFDTQRNPLLYRWATQEGSDGAPQWLLAR
ncbi:hypothetical protein [Amantichitinum ursilacus]|uniref:Uncharacterized protein n=1 Tax=Amantichitinum ursilacus TaxID=857265 RepID=A0A0N0GPS6_9NEIS|nr:hypothetical protein [Amantichitinum ursilacus]KPC54012.1 hypothetical protein WG78_05165 [Amantichitinum ursilacus]